MKKQTTQRQVMSIIHLVRATASFALLGAIIAGIFAGWADHPGGIDVRLIGGITAAIVAVVAKVIYVI
jgi:hypothetical protein